MKNFFRKMFFWDDPVGGAVFGSLLWIVWSFCTVNWWLVFPDLLGVFFGGSSESGNMTGVVHLLCLGALQALVSLYSIFLPMRFFFVLDRVRYKLLFWGVVILESAGFLVGGFYLTTIGCLICCGTVGVLGYHALCIRKNNFHWYILTVLGWLLFLPGILVLWDAVQQFQLLAGEQQACPCPIPPAWRIPFVYGSLACGIAGIFCGFKLWASAVQKPLREVWNTGCRVLISLLVLSYLAITACALVQQAKVRETLKLLEARFQRPLAPSGLKEIYYRNRKMDEKFHADLKTLLDHPGKDDLDFQNIWTTPEPENIPPEFRERFFTAEAEKIGSYFDAPLPACRRDYSPGLFGMMVPDLSDMRQAARFFSTRIRFACEDQDHDTMMRMWRRSGYITEYLRHDTLLISALVLCAVEDIRLRGLKYMISSGLLTDEDLLEIQKELREASRKIPAMDRDALYSEAVFGWDTAMGFVDGTVRGSRGELLSEGLEAYRYISPGMWYWFACNGRALLEVYRAETLGRVSLPKSRSLGNIVVFMLVPGLNTAGERMHALEMRYAVFTVLLEAEKVKRAAGKYPAELPLAVQDHFSGKPLLYRLGEHTVARRYMEKRKASEEEENDDTLVLIGEKYNIHQREKTVYGIKVWSVGRNRIDENGEGDDICVVRPL